ILRVRPWPEAQRLRFPGSSRQYQIHVNVVLSKCWNKRTFHPLVNGVHRILIRIKTLLSKKSAQSLRPTVWRNDRTDDASKRTGRNRSHLRHKTVMASL